jgi:hypothetical protein
VFDPSVRVETRQNQIVFDNDIPEELTPEELERIRRRRFVRALIVIAVVVAMIATILVPVIIRVVRSPRPPDTVIALHAEAVWRRMVT